jgi:ubiquinol-cytochrome c reductase cytochrome b subunit
VMAAAVAILFVLPWLDRSPVRSMRYKGKVSRVAIILFVSSFIILGVLGVKAPTEARTLLARICTVLYFSYFVGIFFWTRWEKTLPEPDRITMDGGMSPLKTLGGFLTVAALVVLPLKVVGAEGKPCGSIDCDPYLAALDDTDSLQRGAKLAVNYCMGCHSFKYSRWERVADDIGIPHDLMLKNMIFSGQKIGELMTIGMTEDKAKDWFGAVPPDLTLVARARSPEWLYTYLRNFYADDTRPLGVNNRVYKDVGMPHVLLELQGLTACAPAPYRGPSDIGLMEVFYGDTSGKMRTAASPDFPSIDPCGTYNLISEGLLSSEEYDKAVFDLVNFMTYVAEPFAQERKDIGRSVLIFLAVFFVFVWLLNREYWKGIH